MKSILHILFLPAVGFISCAPKPAQGEPITRESIDRILNDPNRMTRTGSDFISARPNPETDKAFKIEMAANIVVNYSTDGMMTTNASNRYSGSQTNDSRELDPNQLIRFFDAQPHKDLVVVIIAKQTWSEKELQSRLATLNRYFFDRGYQRVVLQQGLGGGRGTHSDLKRTSKFQSRA